MPVSGVVIRIDPDRKDLIMAELERMEGVELQPVLTSGVLVAVFETSDFESETALSRAVGELPGVLGLSVSYHNFEDMAETEPPH